MNSGTGCNVKGLANAMQKKNLNVEGAFHKFLNSKVSEPLMTQTAGSKLSKFINFAVYDDSDEDDNNDGGPVDDGNCSSGNPATTREINKSKSDKNVDLGTKDHPEERYPSTLRSQSCRASQNPENKNCLRSKPKLQDRKSGGDSSNVVMEERGVSFLSKNVDLQDKTSEKRLQIEEALRKENFDNWLKKKKAARRHDRQIEYEKKKQEIESKKKKQSELEEMRRDNFKQWLHNKRELKRRERAHMMAVEKVRRQQELKRRKNMENEEIKEEIVTPKNERPFKKRHSKNKRKMMEMKPMRLKLKEKAFQAWLEASRRTPRMVN